MSDDLLVAGGPLRSPEVDGLYHTRPPPQSVFARVFLKSRARRTRRHAGDEPTGRGRAGGGPDRPYKLEAPASEARKFTRWRSGLVKDRRRRPPVSSRPSHANGRPRTGAQRSGPGPPPGGAGGPGTGTVA